MTVVSLAVLGQYRRRGGLVKRKQMGEKHSSNLDKLRLSCHIEMFKGRLPVIGSVGLELNREVCLKVEVCLTSVVYRGPSKPLVEITHRESEQKR